MTLLTIHHVQPWTGRLHLVTGVIEKLNIPGDLVHTVHHSSVADTVNHLTVAEFVMQRVPGVGYASVVIMPAGAMLDEAGRIGQNYAEGLADHWYQFSRRKMWRGSDAIDRVQNGIASVLRGSFEFSVARHSIVDRMLNIRPDDKL
jgi:hypothetical protein